MLEYARTGTDLLAVLAARDRKVTEAVTETFGELETKRLRHAGDAQGWWADRAAGDSAALNTGGRSRVDLFEADLVTARRRPPAPLGDPPLMALRTVRVPAWRCLVEAEAVAGELLGG